MESVYCYNCFQKRAGPEGPCPRCGYDPAGDQGKYPFALPCGSVLAGQYITGRVLGQGGFGITYLALDNKLDTRVAIKEFLPDSMAARAEGAHQVTVYTGQRQENFQYGMERFLDEARVLAKFQSNPNIVGVRSYFEENGTAYFVMDYVEGESFKAYIQRQGGKVSWREAVDILTPVMAALDEVHREGIIHRDVTPDNIVLTAGGGVKLLDFGSARYSLGDKSKSLDVVLKAGYAPKEQYIRRGKQGPYTDVYSLAACFYAAMTGYLPPESLERMEEDELVPPSTRGVKLPSGLEDVILKGLEVQPADRYQTMGDFRAALDAALAAETDGPIPDPGPTPNPGPTPDPGPAPDPGPTPEPGPTPNHQTEDTTGGEKKTVPFLERVKALPNGVKGGIAAAACLAVVLIAVVGSGALSGGKQSVTPSGGGAPLQDSRDLQHTAQDGGTGQLTTPDAREADQAAEPSQAADGAAAVPAVSEPVPEAQEPAEVTDKTAADQVAAEKAAAEKAAADKVAADQAAAEKAAAEKAAAEKAAADQAAAEKAAAEKAAADKAAADQAAAEKAAAENTVTNKRCTVAGHTGTYTGEWKDGAPNGDGYFVYDNPSAWYRGTFVNGAREGYGEYLNEGGSMHYVGQFKDNSFEGSGVWDAYGYHYEGNFVKGYPSGKGVATYEDGSKYDGEWKNGKYSGKGTLYKADGTVDKTGTWEKGEFVEITVNLTIDVTDKSYTMVTSKFSVSGTYTGEWKDGKPNGKGTMTMTQSDDRWDKGDTLYSADWMDGLIEGYGQWRSAVDGAYDGNFSKGLKSGQGKMWFSDGTVYDGQWSGGDFVG